MRYTHARLTSVLLLTLALILGVSFNSWPGKAQGTYGGNPPYRLSRVGSVAELNESGSFVLSGDTTDTFRIRFACNTVFSGLALENEARLCFDPNQGGLVISNDGSSYSKIVTAQEMAPAIAAGNVATAAALAANPTDCGGSQFATAIAANGDLTCAQPSAANLSDGTTGTGAVVRATSPTVTGLTINSSVGQGTAFQTASCASGSVNPGAFKTVACAWPVTFPSTGYRVSATAFDTAGGLRVEVITAKTTTSVSVVFFNAGGVAVSGSADLIGVHP